MIRNLNLNFIKRNFASDNIKNLSAFKLFKQSCYHKIDFKINEESNVQEAVIRFNAFNIGCLAVTDKTNKVVGVCSERDYITKVAALGKFNSDIKVKDICTYGPNIIVARRDDNLDVCMQKMMFKDIRHLLIIDDKNNDFIGMISIKDLIKEIQKSNEEIITKLTDFRIGKGAYFGSE
jgi:hypothetical protein